MTFRSQFSQFLIFMISQFSQFLIFMISQFSQLMANYFIMVRLQLNYLIVDVTSVYSFLLKLPHFTVSKKIGGETGI